MLFRGLVTGLHVIGVGCAGDKTGMPRCVTKVVSDLVLIGRQDFGLLTVE